MHLPHRFAIIAVSAMCLAAGCGTVSDPPRAPTAATGAVPVAPNSALEEGLVAHWRFNGDARDSVGKNDAVLVGNPSFVDSAGRTALRIADNRTYARVDTPEVNASGWPGFTVSLWLRPHQYNTYSWVICQGLESEMYGYLLTLSPCSQGTFCVAAGPTGTNGATTFFRSFRTRSGPPPEHWYHLAGTYDGQFVRCYLNGELDGETAVPTPHARTWKPAGGKTYIGTVSALPFRNWGDMYMDGDYAEVRIYQRGLSPAEIAQLYRAGAQPTDDRAARIPAPRPAEPPAPDRRPTPQAVAQPKPVSYSYDEKTSRGVLTVDIGTGGMETRDWVLKNIGKIASSKELLIEAGAEPTTGGRYRVLNESLRNNLLTVEFEVLH